MTEEGLISVKELASKLGVTDASLKKIIKDFELEVHRVKNKISLGPQIEGVIKEILRLRTNGKKNKEIKQLFEEAKVDQTLTKQNTEPKFEQRENQVRIEEELDISEYLIEQIDNKPDIEDDIASALEASPEGDESEDEEELTLVGAERDAPSKGLSGDIMNSRKVRRRAFSFRYIQRQIANDSRRIQYIKHKLKKGKLSGVDRISLEDSLDKRSQLLNGWLHLLRWVKSHGAAQ